MCKDLAVESIAPIDNEQVSELQKEARGHAYLHELIYSKRM